MTPLFEDTFYWQVLSKGSDSASKEMMYFVPGAKDDNVDLPESGSIVPNQHLNMVQF
jgi:hypothetical protein